MAENKKLYRLENGKVFAGVCAGLGEYFDIDPVIFRILFVVLMFAGGSAVLIYIIMWLVMPEKPVGKNNQPDGVERMKVVGQDIKTGAERVSKQIRENNNEIHLWLGILIIGCGMAILLRNFIPLHFFRFDIIAPTLFIILGIYILTKSGGKK